MKLFLSLAYVPTMMVGYVGAAVYLVEVGPHFWALAILLLAAISTSFIVELILPYERAWNRDHGDLRRDIAHFLVNESATTLAIFGIPAVAALIPWSGVWPRDLPVFVQLVIAVLVADFGITVAHYYSHRWQWLWRFHAVHHSVERMYGLNGLMKHPFHQGVEALAGTVPLLLMGIPVEVASLLAFAIVIQLLLQHSNVDIRVGPLRHILALAPVHRFHHQKEAGIGDVNFGLFTTLWDRFLFGTAAYDPERQFSTGEFGIAVQPDYPRAYLQQLVQPFRSYKATDSSISAD